MQDFRFCLCISRHGLELGYNTGCGSQLMIMTVCEEKITRKSPKTLEMFHFQRQRCVVD